MKQDYLWDGSGEPDPEVQKLEQLLAPLRYRRPAPEIDLRPEPASPSRRRFRLDLRIAGAAACLVLAAAAGWWLLREKPYYEVVRLEGSARVGAEELGAVGRLQTGQWLTTDDFSRARIHIGDLGDVEIEANTRIQLVRASVAEQRLRLQRGVLHARIWAPPGSFLVDTPFAQVVDLGCAYTLAIGADGTGMLRVTSGWVAFEHRGRESFVPAGALCRAHPDLGPGTPYRSDASALLQSALEDVDLDEGKRTGALVAVLAEARPEDSLTLWHLLSGTAGKDRAAVYDRLAQLSAPPPGVTRLGILSLNREMLDLWWNQLGLGDTAFWRQWKGPWPGPKLPRPRCLMRAR